VSALDTPLMQQYREIKARHPGAILFFRMGDFYEMFLEDAEVASRVLGLTLTSRNNGGAADVPLAGIPVKAAGEYLRRLVGQGYRVAVCEQVEDPKLAKGIVKREVIETITPGAAFAEDLLDGSRANYVCAVATSADVMREGDAGQVGVAAADLSTGEVRLAVAGVSDLAALLARLSPRELLLVQDGDATVADLCQTVADRALVTTRERWVFDAAMAAEELARQYGVLGLEGFGIDLRDGARGDQAMVGAGGALLRYLRELQPGGVPHLAPPVVERPGGVMPLDEMTRRNLELVESMRGDAQGTLLAVLDRTATPMGQRLLRQWLLAPLLERGAIEARLDAVSALVADPVGRGAVRAALDGVRDVERLASKAAAGRATPRDLRGLGDSLGRLPEVAGALRGVVGGGAAEGGVAGGGILASLLAAWDDGADVAARIRAMLVERPPLQVGEEPTIADGVDAELDQLRGTRDGGRDAIATIQAEERARTGIGSLKVGYNRVFGYFIEISNANRHLVPADYQRRQTLTGAERYVTPALKEYEEAVLGAAERIEARERALFEGLRREVGEAIARWQRVARTVATLDVLAALGEVAERERYVRPAVHDGVGLEIRGGRHPVVERMMPRDQFIPNDLVLEASSPMIVLTGPNMAGKSTILRQVGLIQLLAQVGSWVPARAARVPVVDRLFTRVGASDNLVRGQSTFMVEMAETSAILHTATARSLVLLDEIGRGTSTYDGVSIAWSVSEHLHDQIGCKTVFATHYHELTQLAEELPGVRNFTVAVREVGDRVLFLHTLVPGGADRSYGIEVGRLAGLPAPVIARAKEVLALLEGEGAQMASRLTAPPEAGGKTQGRRGRPGPRLRGHGPSAQLGFFGGELFEAAAQVPADPRLSELAEAVGQLDPDRMTPLEALTALAGLKKSLE
jgi:DNA mismatch repair protein MutS